MIKKIIKICFLVVCVGLAAGLVHFKNFVPTVKLALCDSRVQENFPSGTNILLHYLKLRMGSYFNQDRFSLFDSEFRCVDPLLFKEIFINKVYYVPCAKKDPYIIDCGSNTGMSLLYWKTAYPQAKVLAFEPAPNTFKILEHNIRYNNLDGISLFNKALAKSEGVVPFIVGKEGDLCAHVAQHETEASSISNAINVPTVCLSDYIDREVDILKMDIEGAESEVIQDLYENNKLKNVKYLVAEIHYSLKDSNHFANMLKMLEDNNFGYQIKDDLVWGSSDFDVHNSSKPLINMLFAYNKSLV